MPQLMITDRDLLVLEPSVFVDAAAAATNLLSFDDGSLASLTLTSSQADFDAADIDAGHVLRVDAGSGNVYALEVTGRSGSDSVTVSLPRANDDDASIPPAEGTALNVVIPTLERIVSQAQDWALAALGIDPNHPTHPLTAESIRNPRPVKHLIAMRSIMMAFEIAAAMTPANESLKARSALYSQRSSLAARMIAAMIDLDGDGVADTVRRIDTMVFVRN